MEINMETEKLTGLIAAPMTPFTPNNEIALDQIPLQAESLIADGVTGAYISGSTGEGISCSVSERLAVMNAWHRASAGRLKLIVHIGALSLRDVEVLGRHADELGVYAISVVPANYFKPADVEMLVEFCRVAAETAPHCRFYYYHSSLSGINLPMVDFLKQAHGRIPTLAGIKFNSMNLYEYQNCRNFLDGAYDIVYGTDEFFAGALALGAEAFIGSTFNYAAPLYYKIWRAFDSGDRKTVLQEMKKVCAIVDLLVLHGGVAAGKAMMMRKGIEMGDVRLPLKKLSAADKTKLLVELNHILDETSSRDCRFYRQRKSDAPVIQEWA